MILYTVNKLSTVQIGRKTNLGLTKVSEIINKYLDAYLKDPTQFEEELSPNDLKIYPTVIWPLLTNQDPQRTQLR